MRTREIPMRTRRQKFGYRALALVTAVGLVTAACGNDGDTEATSGSTEATSESTGDEVTAGSDTSDTAGSDTSDTAGSDESKEFIYVLPELTSTFDSVGGSASAAYTGNEQLSTLVAWDHSATSDGGCEDMLTIADVRPELAESWEFREDESLLVFNLREGVLSPFDNELTAEDVKWSFDRFKELARPAKFFYGSISLIDTENDPFVVIDDHTFGIKILQPGSMDVTLNVFFRLLVDDSTEALKHATDADPWATEWLSFNSANFGPWHFTEDDLTGGNEITWTRNPNYFGETGNVDRLIFREVTESSTRAQLLQAGEADAAAFLSFNDYQGLADTPAQVLPCVGPNRDLLLLNEADPRFADVRVRRAISAAIDRETIVANVYLGFADPSRDGLHSRFDVGERGDQFTYDPALARELLAEAGYPDGFDFEITLSPARPGAYAPNLAALIASQLSEVGLNVSLQEIASGSDFAGKFNSGNYQAMVYNESIALPDPAYAWGLIALCEGYQNSFGYCDPMFDELQGQVRATLPGPERDALMRDMAAHIVENPPFIYIADNALPRAFGPGVDVSTYRHTPYVTTLNVSQLTVD